MKFYKDYKFWAVVAAAALALAFLASQMRRETVRIVEKTVTDTLTMVVHDTVVRTVPVEVEVERRIVDTVWVEVPGRTVPLALSVMQKRFSEAGLYDAWVSGVEPLKLDSIRVYNKVITNTVTNTVTRTEIKSPYRIYADIGMGVWPSMRVPPITLGVRFEFPRTFSIGADMTVIDKQPYASVRIGAKLFEW